MAFQTILSSVGPLPLTANFSSLSDGPVDVVVTSTAWTATEAGPIGVQVLIDGTLIGNATLLANNITMHMTLPTIVGTANLTSLDGHSVEVSVTTEITTTDSNDYFTVNLQY